MNIERIPTQMFDNLGQHSIAAYLETKGFIAKVFSGVSRDAHIVIENEIRNNNIPVLGFYVASDNLTVTEHIIKWIKREFDVYVIVGGPEAVALKEEFIRRTGCDFVIEGEGEIPVYQVLSKIIDDIGDYEKIFSIRYISKENIYKENPLSPLIEDLDNIPFPSQKRCLKKNFRDKNSFGIITGRGCPYNCAFCYEGANTKKVRLRSIDNVLKEIDFAISENKNLHYLNIYDDTFTLSPERVREFCKRIKGKGLLWYCEGHISNLLKNPELINIMVDAGMIGLQIGIESASAEVLKAYRKNTTPDMLVEIVKKCKSANLTRLVGNFILGGAFETEDTIKESMNMARKMLVEGSGMFECKTVFLAPYPHTSIAEEPDKYNLELKEEKDINSLFSMKSPMFKTKEIDEDRLISLKNEFDLMIQDTICTLAKTADRMEVYNNFIKDGMLISASSVWKSEYLKQEHIVNFVEGMYSEVNFDWKVDDDTILYNMYPIRTFHLLCESDGNIVYNDIVFKDIEALLLKYSTGKYTLQEISNITNIPIDLLIKSFYKLYDKCFIYMSEF